ncbi:MAG: short-chain alcohol dehydrogenase [Parcubacteria group bacterium Gr01-1014_20]|nr:MAG: short-chain alcohol dehydrogenase [Parcubacteria group bacterium Gr01-1014_20]
MKLKSKVAIITGGSGGIGFKIAEAYLREGARVMISARREDELVRAFKELKTISPEVACQVADVSKIEDCLALVSKTEKTFKPVDILVNSAGIYGPIGPSAEVDIKHWKQTYEINVFGTFQMIQAVLSKMIERKSGKIINFSGGGDGPLPNFSAYNSSKGAIVRLTETLAAEVKGYNVDINCIAPGPVNTKFLEDALSAGESKLGKEKYEELLKQKKDGGVSPEKAADLCLFLASSGSDGLTGKFLSAVWDKYDDWTKEEVEKISRSDAFTLRRIKWEK